VKIYQRAAEVQEANRRLEATNQELLRAKEEAERAAGSDQFLSTMSHELRTPLNAVLGFPICSPTNPRPLTIASAAMSSTFHTGGKHLLTLISDILDLSKIEAGPPWIDHESLRVEAIFGEVLSVMRPLADKNHSGLSKSPNPALVVRADSLQVSSKV